MFIGKHSLLIYDPYLNSQKCIKSKVCSKKSYLLMLRRGRNVSKN